jgi:acyl carrier protein
MVSSEEDILAGVREVLRGPLALPQDVELDTDLQGDLRLDSLQQLTLVVELENRFKVAFAPGDEREVRTVRDVVRLLASHLEKRA